MNAARIEARVLTARYRTDRGTPPRSSWTRDSGLEVMTYERTATGSAGAGGPLDAGATPASPGGVRPTDSVDLPQRGTIEGGVKAMTKKLMPKPTSIVMETRRQWTYATLRPLEAWILGPRSLPKSRAIYYPKRGNRSEQPREREDAQFRPLLCYPMLTAPLS
jgi:hypothetical protein